MPLTRRDLLGLNGKKALVVGGGLGIGRASARMLAIAGASVAVADVDGERAAAVATELTASGSRSVAVTADVMDKAGASRVIEAAATELGDLDVMVNIVGRTSRAPLVDLSDEMFDLDINRNFRHVLRCGQVFTRHLIARNHGGVIVNMASVSGLFAATETPTYGAAKAAVIALTKTMAQQWAPHGIRVNCIAPGSIRTDRSVGTPENDAVLESVIPMGRRGHQDEVAKVVLFLASDLSSYVTGDVIVIDGGLTSRDPFPHPM